MSASLPGSRELPASQYDLNTYWGRVQHTAGITDPRQVPWLDLSWIEAGNGPLHPDLDWPAD